jgi:hypothetical protein
MTGSLVYLLCELVDGGVGWCADEDGAAVEAHQLVDDGGGGDRLPCPRGALDQRQRPLQGVLHCVHLRK